MCCALACGSVKNVSGNPNKIALLGAEKLVSYEEIPLSLKYIIQLKGMMIMGGSRGGMTGVSFYVKIFRCQILYRHKSTSFCCF